MLLAANTTAYNVSREYFLNESAGVIYDEAVNTSFHNSFLTVTLPELILVFIIFMAVVIPFALFLVLIILGFRYIAGRNKKR